MLEKLENATISGQFGFVFEDPRPGNLTIVIVKSSFSESFLFKMFSVNINTHSRRFKFLQFEKIRFRDGLV